MTTKLEKYFKSMPKILKPRINPILKALLEAWAGEDQELEQQIKNCNAQLFVKTAEGTYLDRLASNYGVSRPAELGMLDEDFQQLIPNLSLKAKQVAKSFYDTMDVFWGPLFSRANTLSVNIAPFNVVIGESFTVKIDGNEAITITTRIGDIAIPGAATAKEIVKILNRISGITAESIADPNGDERISLRTNTPGARGSIEIVSPNSFPGVDFGADVKYKITDLAQRTVLYQVNAGEIIIELPAVVPTLRRSLKGSHHFHADSTIEPAIPPENGIWQGSFIYSTTEQPFVVTSQKAILQVEILKGTVINQITVDDSTPLPASGGNLIFNFGKENQEQPIGFITVPNDNTVLIDPGHTFEEDHEVGSIINLLLEGQITPYSPRRDGTDLPVYLTSPASARAVVQEILATLTAAGITVKFVVLLPEYHYLYDNPFEV